VFPGVQKYAPALLALRRVAGKTKTITPRQKPEVMVSMRQSDLLLTARRGSQQSLIERPELCR